MLISGSPFTNSDLESSCFKTFILKNYFNIATIENRKRNIQIKTCGGDKRCMNFRMLDLSSKINQSSAKCSLIINFPDWKHSCSSVYFEKGF